MDVIERIGAYMGLLAFLGLGVLALLYFSQARDVRRLRDWAGRAPERAAEAVQQAAQTYAQQAEPIRRERLRRERPMRRLPEGRYLALIAGGVAILGIGAIVLINETVGGGGGTSEKTIRSGPGGSTPIAPGAVTVAVLNGTDTPGLAAKVGDDVQANGFKLGPITNSDSGFEFTTAMYVRGHRREAEAVAKSLGVKRVALMGRAIRALAGSANVAVVVGADRVV
jgi:LytR cell envelope-related transcriptional attenuator